MLDTRWREHLDNVDYMRQGIGLRGYAQKDPLVEYGIEGQAMFEEMNVQVMQEVVRILMHAEVDVEPGGGMGQPQSSGRGGDLTYQHEQATTLQDLAAAGFQPEGDEDEEVLRTPAAGGAAPGRPRARAGAQRALLVRLGQEVQAVPWRLMLPRSRATNRGRSRI